MPKKKNALLREERGKNCKHPWGFSYEGRMPPTGRQICFMCGMSREMYDLKKRFEGII